MERKPITEFMKKEILHRQHNRCSTIPDYTCPFRGDIFDRSGYHIDHVLPLADGGEDELPNLQALCLCCHRVKTDREQHTRAKRKRSSRSEDAQEQVGSNDILIVGGMYVDPAVDPVIEEILERRFRITRNVCDTVPVGKIVEHLQSSGIAMSPTKIGILLNTLIPLPDGAKSVKRSHGVRVRVGIQEKGVVGNEFDRSVHVEDPIVENTKEESTTAVCPYCPWQKKSSRLPGHLITRHGEHVSIRKDSCTTYLQAYITHLGEEIDFLVCLCCKKGSMGERYGSRGLRWDTKHSKKEDCAVIHASLLAEWKANLRAHRDSVIQYYTDISENTIVLV